MKSILNVTFGGMVLLLLVSYNSKDIRKNQSQVQIELTAKEILGILIIQPSVMGVIEKKQETLNQQLKS